jgi:hypothetical protein
MDRLQQQMVSNIEKVSPEALMQLVQLQSENHGAVSGQVRGDGGAGQPTFRLQQQVTKSELNEARWAVRQWLEWLGPQAAAPDRCQWLAGGFKRYLDGLTLAASP